MVKRFLLLCLLQAAVAPSFALDYTDIWYVAQESGWGVNLVQSDQFMFATFFLYGPDKKPLWYAAQLTRTSSGNFDGPLYATSGTFYGVPWSPPDVTVNQVGTASFQPTNPFTAKLVYTVTSPAASAATVTKTIQRQSLTAPAIAGTYFGGQRGAYSGCTVQTNNASYSDAFTLQVTQSNGTVSLQFVYESGLSCTLAGAFTQNGLLYTVNAATYSCNDGTSTSATLSEVRATSLGIEGRLTAPAVGGGCREDAVFGGPTR